MIRNQVCEDPGEENFWQREQQIQGPDKEWGEGFSGTTVKDTWAESSGRVDAG